MHETISYKNILKSNFNVLSLSNTESLYYINTDSICLSCIWNEGHTKTSTPCKGLVNLLLSCIVPSCGFRAAWSPPPGCMREGRGAVVRKWRIMPLNSITLIQKQPIHFISKKSHVAPSRFQGKWCWKHHPRLESCFLVITLHDIR